MQFMLSLGHPQNNHNEILKLNSRETIRCSIFHRYEFQMQIVRISDFVEYNSSLYGLVDSCVKERLTKSNIMLTL